MTTPTIIPQQINMQQLFSQYGEAIMQQKIATGRVQQIELQLQQILNTQQVPPQV